MAILPIYVYGDEQLTKKAIKVTKVDSIILKLVSDMFDTMETADGLGLAANQVGSPYSIFVIDLSHLEEYAHYGKMIFINPRIEDPSEEVISMEEGCLSLPNLRGEVVRPKRLTLVYQDLSLEVHKLEVDGWFSRVVQHEYDHLLGIFFVDKVEPERRKELKPDLQLIKDRKMDVDYLITSKKKKK